MACKSRDDAIEYFRSLSLRAEKRDWGLGATIVVMAEPSNKDGITIWGKALYLIPKGECWTILSTGGQGEKQSAPLPLEEACGQAVEVMGQGNHWTDYDPTWLVDVAREQCPELADALAGCNRARIRNRAYTHFVDPSAPNQPGSQWQCDRNVILRHPLHGDLVLDVLADGRIGGIEFLDRLQ